MDLEMEDAMWKNIYNKLQHQKSEDHTAHEKRIQEIDGSFFEKFGSLFREQVEYNAKLDNEEHEKIVAEVTEANENTEAISSVEEGEEEAALASDASFDSEDDKEQEIIAAVSQNIDELYTEILYEILHNVGCDVSYEIGQTALIAYVQDVFKMPNEKHRTLFAEAEKKEATEILLNVEIIEAKDLRAKDSNGLSDPFVTLYTTSNSSHRYNTSVKTETLSPTWQEHFSLPMSDHINDDLLNIEVWDFDPAESVKEKFGKFFHVKGLKGVHKLIKEITIAAATGQHENELIGTAKIPLKTIPAAGMTMWYSLDKKNKINRQGVIKIRISFSSEKNSQVAEQEHRHLTRRVLLHELEASQVAAFWWAGSFSPQAETLLAQHIAQSGLSTAEVGICRWSVYASVHLTHPLSFALFDSLLDQLVKPLHMGLLVEEDVKLFWDGARKLLPSCLATIRKIRKKECTEKVALKQIKEVLSILRKLKSVDIPEGFELFPAKSYHWLEAAGPRCTIEGVVEAAVRRGALDWFNHVVANNLRPDAGPNGKLQYLLQAVQLSRSDLLKAIEFYDRFFQEALNFPYAKMVYVVHQEQVVKLTEADVKEACKALKQLTFTGFSVAEETDAGAKLAEGTVLFEVYLALFRFAELGKGLCPTDFEGLHIRDFHLWFHFGVAHWLDIALFKAMQRIEKAVELDPLKGFNDTEKYSSSAVDTLTIFYQVKVFWQQLNWPDVEGCYTFIAKIIDDICRSCIFYGERMAIKVDLMEKSTDEKKFEVTEEWCLAINNIEYVKQSLQPFTNELGIAEVINKLSDLKSPMEAQRCQDTLDNVTQNAIDTIHNKIIDLLETVVDKMVPAMKMLLIEGAELFSQDSNSIDRLMMYVDNNLQTLHNELNEENFNKTLDIVWDRLGRILSGIIESNIEKRRPPVFFENLHKTLNLMMGSFKSQDYSDCDYLKRVERLLKLHSFETAELIHQVHIDVMEEFKKQTKESPFGDLTIRAKFEGDNLKIEIINARNLMAMDSNGLSDPFVRIHFLPEHKFIGVTKPKTQTHYKNLFPLFDETFEINLTHAQKEAENALVMFSVKDKDMLGYNNQYIGEAFIRFSDILTTIKPLSSLSQTVLPLWRPATLSHDSIRALEHRQGDKLAKEFLRRYKQRMGSS